MTFEAGDLVRTLARAPSGHTRLPKYLELRSGRIVRFLGTFREPLYTVEFVEGGHTVCADLFESYLEADR